MITTIKEEEPTIAPMTVGEAPLFLAYMWSRAVLSWGQDDHVCLTLVTRLSSYSM